ncbi:hypothetical protein FJZ53_03575, partial [Candidatus Woesearchaeota archaeon]|nr:hypothetical protein [Candidatus Woesearchaeota archaeon]
MRVPKLFIPEKNLSDKIKDIFKNGKYYNSKYKFRIDLKAFKTDKEFLITYLIPKTYPESDTVRLRIEQIQSSEEDYENFVDLSMSLCSYHGYSIILLGQQKKKEK